MSEQPLFHLIGCDILELPTTMSEALNLAQTREPEVALLDTRPLNA